MSNRRHIKTAQSWLSDRAEGLPEIVSVVVITLLDNFINRSLAALIFSPILGSQTIGSVADHLDVLSIVQWILMIAIILIWIIGWHKLYRPIVLVYLTYVTVFLELTVLGMFLNLFLLSGPQAALNLLLDAGLVWVVSLIVFTLWYWLLDSENYALRRQGRGRPLDFGFPQYATHTPGWQNWQPGFFDYLFIAFTTSATFSPYSDTQVLSPRAKVLLILNIFNSVITIVIIAARAIGLMA